MQLYPASTRDIPQIQAMAARIWPVHYGPIIGMEQTDFMLEWMYNSDKLLGQMDGEGHQFWWVKSAPTAEPDGYIAIRHVDAGEYFMHKFYLDNSSRGRGIGTAAFHDLKRIYPDMKLLKLLVNRRNFRSVNFYFKMGFKIEACVDTPLADRFVLDDYVMCWTQP